MKRGLVFTLHFVIWVLYIAQTVYTSLGYLEDQYGFWFVVVKQYTSYAIIIILFYTNYLVLIPRLLSKKRFFLYFVWIFIMICSGIILMVGHGKLLSLYTGSDYFYETNLKSIPAGIFILIFHLLISVGTRFSIDWFRNQRIKKELQGQKLTAELKLLKSQINPHFLFNTLNNIYSLAMKKSNKTGDAILRLSEIMRYMVNEAEKDKVMLEQEIKYLKDYIELQKLRLKKDVLIDFRCNVQNESLLIAPMLLITHVENAFKHGDTFSGSSKISILLNSDKNMLYFKVENRVKEKSKDTNSGIGIENLKRRLELIYPQRHKISRKCENDNYISELIIDLK